MVRKTPLITCRFARESKTFSLTRTRLTMHSSKNSVSRPWTTSAKTTSS